MSSLATPRNQERFGVPEAGFSLRPAKTRLRYYQQFSQERKVWQRLQT
jgi:hypothetical protein